MSADFLNVNFTCSGKHVHLARIPASLLPRTGEIVELPLDDDEPIQTFRVQNLVWTFEPSWKNGGISSLEIRLVKP